METKRVTPTDSSVNQRFEKVASIKRMISEFIDKYETTLNEAYETILLDYDNNVDDAAENLTRLDITQILDASFHHKVNEGV